MNKKLWLILIIALLNAVGLTIVFPLFPFLIGLYVNMHLKLTHFVRLKMTHQEAHKMDEIFSLKWV
jgi:hypothetical protein